MEEAHNKVCSQEVVPEMRVALWRASDRLGVYRYIRDPEESVTVANKDEAGLTRSVYRRRWFSRFARVSEMLVSEMAAQPRTNFRSLADRRVRALNSGAEQKQFALRRGSRFKAAWNASRKRAAVEDKVARGRDTAPSS